MAHVTIVTGTGQEELDVEDGTSLRNVMIRENISMAFPCGGAGLCGKCRVRLVSGGPPPDHLEIETLSEEELENGIRLACRIRVRGDMEIEVLEQVVEEQILEVGSERGVELDPYIKRRTIKVEPPRLEDPVPDAERLVEAAGITIFKPHIFSKLPSILRENDHSVDIIYKKAGIIDVRAPGQDGVFTIGVDIGTTTVAMTLINMESGRHIRTASVKNPQEPFGGDVISRVEYCSKSPENLAELSGLIRQEINKLVGELCRDSHIERNDIYDIIVVGNTVMNHIFLGADPSYIAQSPYVPALKQGVPENGILYGIEINPGGEVFTAPNIAGFVGGDTVGCILDTGMMEAEEPLVMVDIGTNGEVALSNRGKVYACSTAAGPAFEGVNIKHGMRAGKGAIERFTITDGEVEFSTIGGISAVGICGSGIIDIAAELVNNSIIDATGRFKEPDEIEPSLAGRIIKGDKNEPEFIVVPSSLSGTGGHITLTQGDLRELQLAKGAIASGVTILMEKAGVTADDVKTLFLAGAFGNFIRKESAVSIGLFPGFDSKKIRFIGNAAGYGAVMMLLSGNELEKACRLKDECEYVELGVMPEFQACFAEMMMF